MSVSVPQFWALIGHLMWVRLQKSGKSRSIYSAGWSSLVARRAHNPKVVGSNPTPATNCYCKYNGLGDSTPEPFFFSVQLASKTPHTASPSCAATRFPSSLITWV
jgi:hypothetical protein